MATKRSNSNTPRTGFNPLSGARVYGRSQNQTSRPVLANAAQPSRDAQKLLMQTPQPYANPGGAAKASTGRVNYKSLGIAYEVQSSGPRPQSYGSKVMSDAEMLAAVGEPRKPKGYQQVNNGFQNRLPRRAGPPAQPVASGGEWQTFNNTKRPVPAGEQGAVPGDYKGSRNYTDPTGNRFMNDVMYTDGVKKGSRARGAATANRTSKKGEAPFYGQRP